MDIRQLRQFLAVIEQGSLRGAAQALRLSEPALSKSIRQLEAGLHVRLLDRHARGMTPTIFGTTLAEHARVIHSELRHALNAIDALRGAESGSVTVGTIPMFANDILPRAVAQVLADRPAVRFAIKEALADQLIPSVLSGDCDFAILTMRPYELDPNLVQEPILIDDDAVIAARTSHPLFGGSAVALTDFAACKWVLAPRPDARRLQIEEALKAAGMAPPDLAIECNSALFIKAVLLETDFTGYLPRHLIRLEEERRLLAAFDVAALRVRRKMGFVYRRKGTLSPVARTLMQEIRAICQAS
jgi:DNA-binding transcriptional LysR family regulator